MHNKTFDLEGEEQFGFCKRKLHTMIGSPYASHQINKVNFSMSQQSKFIRLQKTFAHGSLESHFQCGIQSTLNNHGQEALDIFETTCNQKVFHIARTNANSNVHCSTI
jgi:hypothetical protein